MSHSTGQSHRSRDQSELGCLTQGKLRCAHQRWALVSLFRLHLGLTQLSLSPGLDHSLRLSWNRDPRQMLNPSLTLSPLPSYSICRVSLVFMAPVALLGKLFNWDAEFSVSRTELCRNHRPLPFPCHTFSRGRVLVLGAKL